MRTLLHWLVWLRWNSRWNELGVVLPVKVEPQFGQWQFLYLLIRDNSGEDDEDDDDDDDDGQHSGVWCYHDNSWQQLSRPAFCTFRAVQYTISMSWVILCPSEPDR